MGSFFGRCGAWPSACNATTRHGAFADTRRREAGHAHCRKPGGESSACFNVGTPCAGLTTVAAGRVERTDCPTGVTQQTACAQTGKEKPMTDKGELLQLSQAAKAPSPDLGDRRAGADRRRETDRRSGNERRSGPDRRKFKGLGASLSDLEQRIAAALSHEGEQGNAHGSGWDKLIVPFG